MKFSIVTATYNRKEALKRCVESILAQTHQDFEHIVVDDGSTDGTTEMMQQYTDPRIRYIQLDKNYGTATPARNRGIDEMTGNALIVWDSDDLLLPNALKVLEFIFINHPHIGVACTSTQFIENGEPLNLQRMPPKELTIAEWFCGGKPRDAEIIAIKKNFIQDARFESRGIDFMFYSKMVGTSQPKMWYENKTCGTVFLESDALSLTTARRKKKNKQLSIQRAPILADFLDTYGHFYIEGGCPDKYAGHAFGAGFGFLLAGDIVQARQWLKRAVTMSSSPSSMWRILLLSTYIPGGQYIVSKLY
jgi:glycosyltransferase involved in cell wall biosynthesis